MIDSVRVRKCASTPGTWWTDASVHGGPMHRSMERCIGPRWTDASVHGAYRPTAASPVGENYFNGGLRTVHF